MTSDELMSLITHLCEAYQNSTAHRVAASYETNHDEQGVQRSQEQQWNQLAAHRLGEVERAVRAALPAVAATDLEHDSTAAGATTQDNRVTTDNPTAPHARTA